MTHLPGMPVMLVDREKETVLKNKVTIYSDDDVCKWLLEVIN